MTGEADRPTPGRTNPSFGWLHLLPPLSGLRLLCVDTHGGLTPTLARNCLEVVLLPDLSGNTAQVSDFSAAETGAPVRRMTLVELSIEADRSNAQAALYDGLIVHDPEGFVVHGNSLVQLQDLLRRALPTLRPEAFVYLGLRNAWSPRHLLRRLTSRTARRDSPLLSPLRMVRLLEKTSFSTLRVHPYLLQDERVAEILPRTGFRSTKNRELANERVKEKLLGSTGSRLFAPAYGIVAHRDSGKRSTLETLLKRLAILCGGDATRHPVMKQFLVFAGHKAIVSIGPEETNDGDLIVVMVADALSKARRRSEVTTLDQLARLPPAISTRVPRVLDQFEIDGTLCIVMDRLPGVTLDSEVPPLETVTDAALDFLIELHAQTTVSLTVDDDAFQTLFGHLIDAACRRNEDLTEDLQALVPVLRQRLEGRRLPTVWFHGDYKVENVMYSPDTLRVTGVIDWEHATRPGLPLLDLHYLLIYNRTIRGMDWIDAVQQLMLDARPTDREQSRLLRYAQVVGIEDALLPALEAMFVVHQIGCRLHLPADLVLRRRVRSLLRAVADHCSIVRVHEHEASDGN